MQITEHEHKGVVILGISGRIDAGTSDQLKFKLLAAIGDKPVRLVLDFSQVEFVSSIGLRVLIVAAKRIAVVKGKMVFSGLAGPVREVFELAGFTSVAKCYADQAAAIAALA